MLIRFSVEPSSLLELKDHAIFDTMLNIFWIPFGILVDFASEASIRDSNSSFSDELETLFKSYHSDGWPLWVYADKILWDDIMSPSDMASYQDRIQLALVEETRAMVALQIPESDRIYSRYCGDVEAIRFRHIPLSKELANAIHRSDENIPIHQPISELWKERFQILARYSEQVTIVDRFALKNFHSGHPELINLLELLQSDVKTPCRITIYSAFRDLSIPDLYSINSKLNAWLRDIINRDTINQVTVFVSHDSVFIRRAHDRYVRFGGYTITIGRGIEIFRNPRILDESDFSYKSPRHLQERRNIERALRKRLVNMSNNPIPWRWRATE